MGMIVTICVILNDLWGPQVLGFYMSMIIPHFWPLRISLFIFQLEIIVTIVCPWVRILMSRLWHHVQKFAP